LLEWRGVGDIRIAPRLKELQELCFFAVDGIVARSAGAGGGLRWFAEVTQRHSREKAG
jgi:hypothetical protein